MGLVHAEGGEGECAADKEDEDEPQDQFDHDMIMEFKYTLHT